MASPAPSLDSLTGVNPLAALLTDRSLSPPENGDSSPTGSKRCPVCNDAFTTPKSLSCFHTFCLPCLEKIQDHPEKITCTVCLQETTLTSQGILGLYTDYSVNVIEKNTTPRCTGCKNKKTDAVARCIECNNFLCASCVMAHQFMHCFEGHRVTTLDIKEEPVKNGLNGFLDKPTYCPRHKTEIVKFLCTTCNTLICQECTLIDHPLGLHETERLSDIGPKLLELLNQLMQEARTKATELYKNNEQNQSKLQIQYHKAQNEINETFQFYRSMIEERKQELLKELESTFSTKQVQNSIATQKSQDVVERITQTCDTIESLAKNATTTQIMLFRKLMENKIQAFNGCGIEFSSPCDLEFVSNFQAIQVGVRNTFGYVRASSEVASGPAKQPPIARPTNGVHVNGVNGIHVGLNGGIDRPYTNGIAPPPSTSPILFDNNIISKRFNGINSLGPFTPTIGDLNINGLNPYEKWSTGSNGDIFQNGDHFSVSPSQDMLELTSKLMSTAAMFPPKSQIKRQKMIYHCKFGEFGVMEGQFTEPSGVAVNAQNDIIVADTNNHRIQIFDKEGRFKFQFGECGKRDGQLLYPNRVAVVRTSGDIIVTERSPTHQIQIYNQYGQFVRKFGANILQHPRGVTVDNKGRIVVVECKVMRVIIFDQSGNVLQKFGCSKHLEFPNGVVVNDKQEIFISDNRAHCVKVFNYEGSYLRQIGGEGITNYPIGVGINAAGEILIADNHNNFNLTIFTQDGQLVSALESKVKHAQCFDVALMDDGSVVLASKDYRLYIYRYVQVPPLGL